LNTKTVTPHVRAYITFPLYILLYLNFWTNVMHCVIRTLLDRSLCFKSGDDHILVPLHPPHPELTHFRVRLRAQKAAIVAASTNPTKAMYKSSHT